MSASREIVKRAVQKRQHAYKATFKGALAQEVLEDLMHFCRANETCVVPGDRDATLILEGRREVFLRIQEHLNLSPEQMWDLYTGNRPHPLARSVAEMSPKKPEETNVS